MNKVSIIKYSVAACIFLAAGGLYYSASTAQAGNESGTYYEMTIGNTEDGSYTNEQTTATIYVYICGFVEQPGVYSVIDGSRIFEVINMAGGLTKEAVAGSINQAETVCDGDMIYIPYEGESVKFKSGNKEDSGLVNINSASTEQLMTLPGIGESRAKAIVDYREQNGGYNTIEDIMNVSGIKESAFNKIKDYICVK